MLAALWPTMAERDAGWLAGKFAPGAQHPPGFDWRMLVVMAIYCLANLGISMRSRLPEVVTSSSTGHPMPLPRSN